MEKRGRGRGVLAVKNILEGDSPRIKGRGRGILHVRPPNTQPIGVQTGKVTSTCIVGDGG